MIRVAPSTLNRKEQFAFFANLYNAKTIDIVLDHYPVRSIKEISLGGSPLAVFSGGPWKEKVVAINAIVVSLDDIEHEMLRKSFRDPRVHYALNCASLGCPNITRRACSRKKLEAQLDAAARVFVIHPRGVHIGAGTLVVSSIYEWFKADFGGSNARVLRHLLKYAKPGWPRNSSRSVPSTAMRMTGVSMTSERRAPDRGSSTRPPLHQETQAADAAHHGL